MKFSILFSITILISTFCFAQPGTNDATFNTSDVGFNAGFGPNYSPKSSFLQPDGKIVIVGNFTTYNNINVNHIVRLQIDGSVDTSFNAAVEANFSIYCAALQADGKIIIGGSPSNYNGVLLSQFKRLHADGSLDSTFYIGPVINYSTLSGSISKIVIQPDQKILVAGVFDNYNGTSTCRIIRLNTDGSLDSSFNSCAVASYSIYAVSLQTDGKIIIAGTTSIGSQKYVKRLNSDGTLDNSFNVSADDAILESNIQPDGKVIVGGVFTVLQSTSKKHLARLNSNGTIDNTFNIGIGTDWSVHSSAIQSDGKIIIGGAFTQYNGNSLSLIMRLNPDGSVDSTFYTSSNTQTGEIVSINIQSDGKIIIVGGFSNFEGKFYIARLNADGSVDFSFNPSSGANFSVLTTSSQTDGKILIGGSFISYNNNFSNRIARLNSDGNTDTTFHIGIGANDWVRKLILQPDEKIIVCGDFSQFNGSDINCVVRLNVDGSIDSTFNIGLGFNHWVLASEQQPDGKIISGGYFTAFNGQSATHLVRLNNDGSRDNTFNFNGSSALFTEEFWAIAPQTNGKIIIGGNFTIPGQAGKKYLARLNANGTVDNSFNMGTGLDSTVYAITVQPNGKIIIGGDFTSYNSTSCHGILRLNSNGTIDNTFNFGTGTDATVRSITLQPDGKIIISGNFTNYNGISINRIARLNPDGLLDNTFNTGSGFNNTVYSTSLLPDSKIIAGGLFISYNGIGRNRVARLNNCIASLRTDTIVSCAPYTWIDGITYTSSNNTALFQIPANGINSCDSIIKLNFTLTPPVTSVTVNTNMLTSNASSATYQWLNCDSNYAAISGATSQSFSPSVNGNYAVIVTFNNCTDTSNCYNIYLSGISEMNSNGNIIINPNPFTTNTNLSSEKLLVSATLLVYNNAGELVIDMKNLNGHNISLMRDNLPNGIYLIRLTEGNELIGSKKIIILD